MLAILKNRTIRTLSGANLFETLGISIFNIILITYAKDFNNPNIFVSIVSVASILPGILGALTGRLGDNTAKKGQWLLFTKLIQAFLYIVLAQIIDAKSAFIFTIVILINIVSDTLGSFSTSIRMPILQNKVKEEDRQQAIGFNQSISTLIQPLGQTLGVVIIETTHDYALAGYINAVTFLLAALVLGIGQKEINVRISKSSKNKNKDKKESTIKTVFKILNTSSGLNVINLIVSFTIINAVGASIDAILNLFLLQNEASYPFSFSVAVLITNIAFVLGSVCGNLSHQTYFDQLSFRKLEILTTFSFLLVYVNLITIHNYWLLLFLIFGTTFGLGKVNPKISKNIMDTADPKVIGSVFGVVGSISTASLPIGSVGLVLIYNIYSANAAYLVSIILLITGILSILIAKPNSKRNKN